MSQLETRSVGSYCGMILLAGSVGFSGGRSQCDDLELLHGRISIT